MDDSDLNFDFEENLEPANGGADQANEEPPDLPAEEIGQQPGNFKKNYRQTVCTYWLRGLCMKGDQCGFLHQFDPERMPVCRSLLKYGECQETDCPFKHTLDDIKECNMYRLGFCIYGPQCRYKHKQLKGPPPDPATVEACKPKEYRNINLVVNTVNPGVAKEEDRKRFARNNPLAPPTPAAAPSGPSGPPSSTAEIPAKPPHFSDHRNHMEPPTPSGHRGPRPPPGPPPPFSGPRLKGPNGQYHDRDRDRERDRDRDRDRSRDRDRDRDEPPMPHPFMEDDFGFMPPPGMGMPPIIGGGGIPPGGMGMPPIMAPIRGMGGMPHPFVQPHMGPGTGPGGMFPFPGGMPPPFPPAF